MHIALMVVPLLVLLGLMTCAIELSALLLRQRVRWSHALLFAVVIAVLSIAAQGVSARWGLWVGSGIGIVLELALGGWFFGERATRKTGGAIGWVRGVFLTGVAQLLLLVVGLAIIWLRQMTVS